MLIAMAGLPGSGKSTIAEGIARSLGCALLSVDPIEAAMWRAGIHREQPTGVAAYVVAEDLAREQLVLGNDAIVDAVNDVDAARGQWTSLAAELGQKVVFIEVYCSDETAHRRRLEGRNRALVGFPEPTWESVVTRGAGFEAWDAPRLRLDSMRSVDENVATALEHLDRNRMRDSSSGQGC
ncbi:AAA family ATPase [Microbacterium dauci]|uniref:AAA family ATPase n=1 Tax=Microbacterium dauci TaxID=3048008 RepID=A0ABT6ZB78_9MICO|nr:AAA family ATPase [Microbacterium sp. LX3-4]MDJ1113411.1 AAA family ATPase [Microbacterium sp. LX3-4]